MKMRALPLIIVFTTSMSLAYFWEDWGKQMTPEERRKKEEIDLKYRQKSEHLQYKTREKQQELQHKKEKLELDRQKDRLHVEND